MMDEGTLNDLLECSVCLERLDTSNKVLPCQHTFCRKCLQDIVNKQNELRCPECRILVTTRIDNLPPNVLLMRILEGLKKNVSSEKQGASGVNHTQHKISNKSNSQNVSYHPYARPLYNNEQKKAGPLAANDSPVPYRCQTSPFEPKPVYPLPEFAPRPGVRPYFCGTVMPRMGGTIPQLPVMAGPWNNLSRFNTTQSNAMIPQMRTQPPNCPPFVTQRNPMENHSQSNRQQTQMRHHFLNPHSSQPNIRTTILQNPNSGIPTASQVSQPNQAGNLQAQSPAYLSHPPGYGRERPIIWQGRLEWSGSPHNVTDPKIPCQVSSANWRDVKPELTVDGWPSNSYCS